ncbi:T9SS type A sorting domain-containing protein [Wenyingzhuangia sp. 1_MG-2023]|nr:T9SS type A sorting domain-containing protein [Wenyingzhuangia sp. 1_MG-2023]
MSKLKILLMSPLFLLLGNKIHAQHLWYENETETENITFTRTVDGTFTTDETNPDVSGININTTSSKFVRNADVNRGFTYFDLFTPLTTASKYTITLKAYTDVATSDLSSEPNRLRIYLRNTTTGDFKQITKKFTIGQAWEEFSFVFDKADFTTEGLGSGGYNQLDIGYGNGQESTSTITYYIDQIHGSIPQIPLEEVLKGSWGGRFYIRAGEDLDDYVDNRGYDYIAGAQEIADSYPTMGHVITNATNNANSQLWTLRTNPNVDTVMGATGSVVDEEFVPSLANEQIIIDVIDIFKNSGKKVILYVNTQSPANRATAAGAVAWNNYVDTYFAGDGHAAWMNYCEGYIKRFTEIGVDGYWFDSFGSYNINNSLGANDVASTTEQKAEFVAMIRNAAPNAIITTNIDKDSFVDENGDLILVDTDGVDELVGVDGTGDDPNRDYAIIKMTATNSWSDFTAGHITPLGQGAPPNSWAYEEFTVTDIEESSISIYEENSKQTLKHLFLPIRSTWSSERSDLMFNNEQAYRFAKRITDAGGSVTFSNTTATDGTTSEDEVEILTFIDQQFAINADATVYVRPEGAFLVGEDQNLSIETSLKDDLPLRAFPNPVKDVFSLTKEVLSGVLYNTFGAKSHEFNNQYKNIDISNLSSGLYLLQVNYIDGRKEHLKLLKE